MNNPDKIVSLHYNLNIRANFNALGYSRQKTRQVVSAIKRDIKRLCDHEFGVFGFDDPNKENEDNRLSTQKVKISPPVVFFDLFVSTENKNKKQIFSRTASLDFDIEFDASFDGAKYNTQQIKQIANDIKQEILTISTDMFGCLSFKDPDTQKQRATEKTHILCNLDYHIDEKVKVSPVAKKRKNNLS